MYIKFALLIIVEVFAGSPGQEAIFKNPVLLPADERFLEIAAGNDPEPRFPLGTAEVLLVVYDIADTL